jgi:integrase
MDEDAKPRGRRADHRARLTDGLIAAQKPRKQEFTYWDSIVRGFGVRVRPSGHSVFVVTYRSPRTGKQTRHTIGDAQRLTTDQARASARTLLAQIELGDDPKLSTRTRTATVRSAYEAYRDLPVQALSPVWARKTQALIERIVLPKFGDVALETWSRGEIRSLIDPFVMLKPTTALQLHRVISAFLSWCVDRDLVPVNVLRGTKLPVKPRSRSRVLTDKEIALVIRAAEGLPKPWPSYIKLLLLTAQRKSEVLGMHADEMSPAAWDLDGDRTKNGHHNHIPLSTQAQTIVGGLLEPGKHLFRVFDRDTPMKFRQDIMDQFRRTAGVTNFTLHDIRRTGASKMAELGVAPHVIEAILNHRSGVISGVAAIYNRYNYAVEKREALQMWADRLDQIERDYPDPGDGVEL